MKKESEEKTVCHAILKSQRQSYENKKGGKLNKRQPPAQVSGLSPTYSGPGHGHGHGHGA